MTADLSDRDARSSVNVFFSGLGLDFFVPGNLNENFNLDLLGVCGLSSLGVLAC